MQVIILMVCPPITITANYDEILPPLMKGLEQSGLKVGHRSFVPLRPRGKLKTGPAKCSARKVVILLVGERPGLGRSESLSCAVCSPTVAVPWKQTVPYLRILFTAQGHRRWKPPLLSTSI